MGFPRQEYQSGLPFASPEDLSDPRIETMSPALQADLLPMNQGSKNCGYFLVILSIGYSFYYIITIILIIQFIVWIFFCVFIFNILMLLHIL